MTAPTSYWPRIERWMGWAAWIGLGIEAVLWFALAGVSIENLLFLLCIVFALVLGTWVFAALFVVRYRWFFGTWLGFAGVIAAFALATWGRGLETPSGITGLLLMGTLGLMVAFPVSMILLSWPPRDGSVALIGLSLMAFLWGSLLASVPYGGPIRVWLLYTAGTETSQFWWFETLTCLLMLALPLGSLAFFLHLIRLVAKEIQGR